jgi:hypothetical protein
MDKGLMSHYPECLMYVHLQSCKSALQVVTGKVSQHGRPHQVFDVGGTALDEETFNEYLEEMREHYTADKVSGGAPLPANRLRIGDRSTIYWVSDRLVPTMNEMIQSNYVF